jgi:hypothetical protein
MVPPPPSPATRYTRASELAEHAYCRRAWWLRQVQGVPPANVAALGAGEAAHRRHGRAVRRSAALRRLAMLLAATSATLLLAALLAARLAQ